MKNLVPAGKEQPASTPTAPHRVPLPISPDTPARRARRSHRARHANASPSTPGRASTAPTRAEKEQGSPAPIDQSAASLRTGPSPAYRTWGPARGVRVAGELGAHRHGGGHDRRDALAERARAHRRAHGGAHRRGRGGGRGAVAHELLEVVPDGGHDELCEWKWEGGGVNICISFRDAIWIPDEVLTWWSSWLDPE